MAAQHPDPLNEARALIHKGAYDEATRFLSDHLNKNFFHDDALFLLGGCFAAGGMNGLSAAITSAAIDARRAKGHPFPEALRNLGIAYQKERHQDTAFKIFQDALKFETIPRERAQIMSNIAALFTHVGTPEKAISWANMALAEDPQCHGALANRGIANLELGNWKAGWEGFYHAYDTGDRTMRKYGRIKEWTGEPGQRVIVFGDQGIGDEILFAECLNDMIELSEHVILDCHPRLERLFKRSFPKATVYGTRKHLSALDWLPDCKAEAKVGLADLPIYFRHKDGDWSGKPYLVSGHTQHRDGRAFRIGISWVGGTKITRTELRSVSLHDLRPIFRVAPDAEWFSLQYTPDAAREVCKFEEETGIRISHFPGKVECFDYDETASFVAGLDLIITVCTTVHHLGAALGIPTWTLVPKHCAWRYGGGKDTLPWYGSAKLFRQEKAGEWSTPINRIADELHAHNARVQAA